MDRSLSPHIEQYLSSVVAQGLFPSEEAALEAAIDALREKTGPVPFVPDEHMARVEQAIESANAGRTAPMTPEYWAALKQIVSASPPRAQ
ncbi:MAG TPA: hypothetical protein VMF30_00485 [Pirellulales bacterium]|nr:hypothetical protein [Pirellulales bacterium]